MHGDARGGGQAAALPAPPGAGQQARDGGDGLCRGARRWDDRGPAARACRSGWSRACAGGRGCGALLTPCPPLRHAERGDDVAVPGVHIGTYGQDRSGWTDPGATPRGSQEVSGPDNPGARPRGWSTLGDLLKALITAVPAVRFRLSSIEATEVDDSLARLLIEAPRNLAAHLHAPLQSGSNRVLRRMGRHWYTAESYRARIEWLAERLPVFGLGADVIAGFPGESEDDHQATLTVLRALPFTYLHVFPFSVRLEAAAARLPGQLAPEVIRERARELREVGETKGAAYRTRRSGQTADGVVSGRQQGRLEVMTEDYLSVYLDTHLWDGRPRFEVTVN